MAFKALVNGVEVKKKNRIVLEIVKQYVERDPNISYEELKIIFPDKLQGSIGVIKNEKELDNWEEDGRTETRERRFFTNTDDVISLNGDKIYVCDQWGDSENVSNFKPFIKYAQEKLGFDIEYSNKSFYGLWVSRDADIKKIIESGIWKNKLSNENRLVGQIKQLVVGDEVFLFQCIEDVKVKDSPFSKYLPKKYEYMLEKNIVKAKSWAIGRVRNTNMNDFSIEIDWDDNYTPNEWYVYCRQDGVWHFDMSRTSKQQKYKELYDIVFNGKTQNYQWWIDNKIFDRYKNNQKEGTMVNNKNIKNIILYGAPGVGKTHNTNKLIRLIEDGKSDKEIFEVVKDNENSATVDISDIKERVKFVTFHQSFGYEDFIEGFRPNEDGDIELVDGIFKNICMVAEKNLKDSNKSAIEIEQNLDLLSIFKNYVNYKIEEAEPIKLKKGGEFYLTKFENDKLFFNTTKDSNHFQDFVLTFDDFQKIYNADIEKKTLQDISDILGTNSIQQKYAYILAIYKDFINKKDNFNSDNKNKNNIAKKQNYYLVIDEINRGNISKIFGELITLIEEDKRDVLEVTLPYSKKPFMVPSNLYIIGTMNSTDKSIALIDIALRRRFTFLKMEPNVDLINDEKAREIFVKLNDKIKDDLGKDYQLGHSYFMKIQNRDDLRFVLGYKIIPLLEEYYYGDDRLDEIIAICKI